MRAARTRGANSQRSKATRPWNAPWKRASPTCVGGWWTRWWTRRTATRVAHKTLANPAWAARHPFTRRRPSSLFPDWQSSTPCGRGRGRARWTLQTSQKGALGSAPSTKRKRRQTLRGAPPRVLRAATRATGPSRLGPSRPSERPRDGSARPPGRAPSRAELRGRCPRRRSTRLGNAHRLPKAHPRKRKNLRRKKRLLRATSTPTRGRSTSRARWPISTTEIGRAPPTTFAETPDPDSGHAATPRKQKRPRPSDRIPGRWRMQRRPPPLRFAAPSPRTRFL
mmetsp:Transcript_13126/g.43821  ORF Transcript_13126/g.43821 Transcript_13126/m.43821 type:complete len:281 (-) Transcript_13126:17-859(-)